MINIKKDVEIFAVNATVSDPVQEASAFANRYGFEFPVLLDMDGVAGLDYKSILFTDDIFC